MHYLNTTGNLDDVSMKNNVNKNMERSHEILWLRFQTERLLARDVLGLCSAAMLRWPSYDDHWRTVFAPTSFFFPKGGAYDDRKLEPGTHEGREDLLITSIFPTAVIFLEFENPLVTPTWLELAVTSSVVIAKDHKRKLWNILRVLVEQNSSNFVANKYNSGLYKLQHLGMTELTIIRNEVSARSVRWTMTQCFLWRPARAPADRAPPCARGSARGRPGVVMFSTCSRRWR